MTKLFFSDYYGKYCVLYNGKAVATYIKGTDLTGIIKSLKNLGYIDCAADLVIDL